MTRTELFEDVRLVQRCRACGDEAAEKLLRLDNVPVAPTQLWGDATQARHAPRGDLDLRLCQRCGLVWNAAVDSARVQSTLPRERSPSLSPTFHQHLQRLAARLVSDHDLCGQTVVDLDCGRGDFLELLCEAGARRGIGFDSGADGDEPPLGDGDVTIERRAYSPDEGVQADLVCVRHGLQHVEDPVGFLQQLTGVRPADERPLIAHLEVPNADFVFSHAGMWGLTYQHVTFFAEAALQQVAEAAGFTVVRLERSFHGQLLSVDAIRTPGAPQAQPPTAEAGAFVRRARRLPQLLRTTLQRWQRRLATDHHTAETVLWGAGAKGAMFLNLADPDRRLAGVVDLDPGKWRRYVAGTGHRVIAPAELVASPPRTIVVVNPAYLLEIRRMATGLGLDSEVIGV